MLQPFQNLQHISLNIPGAFIGSLLQQSVTFHFAPQGGSVHAQFVGGPGAMAALPVQGSADPRLFIPHAV